MHRSTAVLPAPQRSTNSIEYICTVSRVFRFRLGIPIASIRPGLTACGWLPSFDSAAAYAPRGPLFSVQKTPTAVSCLACLTSRRVLPLPCSFPLRPNAHLPSGWTVELREIHVPQVPRRAGSPNLWRDNGEILARHVPREHHVASHGSTSHVGRRVHSTRRKQFNFLLGSLQANTQARHERLLLCRPEGLCCRQSRC